MRSIAIAIICASLIQSGSAAAEGQSFRRQFANQANRVPGLRLTFHRHQQILQTRQIAGMSGFMFTVAALFGATADKAFSPEAAAVATGTALVGGGTMAVVALKNRGLAKVTAAATHGLKHLIPARKLARAQKRIAGYLKASEKSVKHTEAAANQATERVRQAEKALSDLEQLPVVASAPGLLGRLKQNRAFKRQFAAAAKNDASALKRYRKGTSGLWLMRPMPALMALGGSMATLYASMSEHLGFTLFASATAAAGYAGAVMIGRDTAQMGHRARIQALIASNSQNIAVPAHLKAKLKKQLQKELNQANKDHFRANEPFEMAKIRRNTYRQLNDALN